MRKYGRLVNFNLCLEIVCRSCYNDFKSYGTNYAIAIFYFYLIVFKEFKTWDG